MAQTTKILIIDKHMAQKIQGYRLSGSDVREILDRCGYKAWQFAEALNESGAPISTERSVYRLEQEYWIKLRYVEPLIRLVGKEHFDRCVAELIIEHEEREQASQERQLAREKRNQS